MPSGSTIFRECELGRVASNLSQLALKGGQSLLKSNQRTHTLDVEARQLFLADLASVQELQSYFIKIINRRIWWIDIDA